ncbi:threonine/serine ThrE exporter family protein [Agromyces seonyuensis]|uniref:Threonine/serine exporter family protein n=1 Tax=Agromyces seonyuensis TaxID=2662446 RepID=A0A6I4P4V9_9MICO|nr:threonine/serine exporter family protein [Agromyces seonyuensis]MWB99399.1 threonine/serine exporter family protein [Agromyces seonyuensis]
MTDETQADEYDAAALRRFLLGLGEGMNASESSVDRTSETLQRVATAYGARELEFFVLPTAVMVQTGEGDAGRVGLRTAVNVAFRFDQIAALYRLIAVAERGKIEPVAGIRTLNDIGAMKPRWGWFTRTFGHALLTTGLALLLVPNWWGAVIAFALGAVIGLVKLIPSSTLGLILPIVVAFGSALVVFPLATVLDVGDPVLVLIAPLCTFLPGGALTTGTMELATGQTVAGASRLVKGLVQLALLTFGIVVAGSLLGVDQYEYVSTGVDSRLGWWAGVLGLVLFAVGNYLHFSAPGRTFPWVFLVLVVAYLAQLIGAAVGGATISGFVGALAMTPVVLWIGGLKRGAPTQLTFLPAFWLLVPGATGLVGFTEAVGAQAGLDDFAAAFLSIISIALGVLIGTALYRLGHQGAEEIFHIDEPATPSVREDPGLVTRLMHVFPWNRPPEHPHDHTRRDEQQSAAEDADRPVPGKSTSGEGEPGT